jgi:hypothetical protein
MARPDLHKFKRDLSNVPAPGSDAPPRTIRASDLDGNFTKVTVIEPPRESPPSYTVEYTKDGTVLRLLPEYPQGSTLHVLGVQNGQLRWVATTNC